MNIVQSSIAKKYARAFINLYVDKLDQTSLERFEEFILFIKNNKDILFYIQSAFIKQTTKIELIDKFIVKFSLIGEFKNLIYVLVADKRLFLLADVLKYCIELYRHYKNIIAFTVMSSHTLTERELIDIKEFLAQATQATIILKKIIDKRLIMGIKLVSDTFVWEYSVKKQLTALEHLK